MLCLSLRVVRRQAPAASFSTRMEAIAAVVSPRPEYSGYRLRDRSDKNEGLASAPSRQESDDEGRVSGV